MVGAPCADDAVRRAKSSPGLAVGLHIVVVRGRPVLAAGEVAALVDARGEFDDELVRAGVRYFFLPAARRQLAAEIRAQFEAFAATGLTLDHVNAHNHMHVHPTVLGMILKIGPEFGMRAVRLPFEPSPRLGFKEFLGRLFLAPWIALMKRRILRAGVGCNDRVFGLRDTGRMGRERVVPLLENLPEGVSEMFFHPATGPWEGVEANAEGFRFEAEYRALIDPGVAQAVTRSGAELVAFRDIWKVS